MEKVDTTEIDNAKHDFPHTTTDEDVGNGIENNYLDLASELQARHNTLSRKLEQSLNDSADWLELSASKEAQALFNLLEESLDILGQATEETDDEMLDSGI